MTDEMNSQIIQTGATMDNKDSHEAETELDLPVTGNKKKLNEHVVPLVDTVLFFCNVSSAYMIISNIIEHNGKSFI